MEKGLRPTGIRPYRVHRKALAALRLLALFWLFLLGFCCAGPSQARPWVVAHRGGPALGPENLVTTFQKACDLGVDAIELDIHQSQDGGLFVIHDETLDRTFGRTGTVAQMTRRELLAAGVPSLHQALRVIRGRARLLVEIKHPRASRYEGIEKRLLQLLREQKMLQDTTVISFDPSSLKLLHELDPSLPTGLLVLTQVDPVRARKELGITILAPHFSRLDDEYRRAIRAAGLQINVWTVNSEKDLNAMLAAGCDSITTDEPWRLMRLLDNP